MGNIFRVNKYVSHYFPENEIEKMGRNIHTESALRGVCYVVLLFGFFGLLYSRYAIIQ